MLSNENNRNANNIGANNIGANNIRYGGFGGLQSDQLSSGEVQAGKSGRILGGLGHCCLLRKVTFDMMMLRRK